MQKFKFGFYLLLTLALCWVLNGKRGALPAVGKLVDPFHGFWQNCEAPGYAPDWDQNLPELYEAARVVYDKRRVPHIFAENEHDLFFLQGYITAQDRLWQMEFQTMAAAGRLSEILDNPRVLKLDKMTRRRGMGFASEKTNEFVNQDPHSKATLDAYSQGVNAYISSLSYSDLPFEYKLLDYRPEKWNSLKTSYLLKMMANMLTGRTEDFPNSNSITLMGPDHYASFYPDLPDSLDPIIPVGTPYDFVPVSVDTPSNYVPASINASLEYPKIDPHNGSNNWAVSGKKTASGNPILCNDPHLGLSFPAIWYEMQLSAPDINVYGVTLPGSPLVIIGFNEKVAWGVTNASRDVLDWYQIEFKDESRQEYKFDGKWLPTERRIEEIKIRGKESVYDTVIYTQHGPVVYDRNFGDELGGSPINLAMRWMAHESSNEMRTFYGMAKARNHADYRKALRHFDCPGQNIIFAASDGDIAITQQGKFPVKWQNQGKFILDGSDPKHLWQAYIPFEHNPTVKNPERGFVSSANQHPADSTYPYNQSGYYEYYRNRVINKTLAGLDRISPQDMQDLQNNNFNLLAAESLPSMLDSLETEGLNTKEKELLAELKGWNYLNDPDLKAPAIWESWALEVFRFFSQAAMAVNGPVAPPSSFTISQIINDPKCSFMAEQGFFVCPKSIPSLVTQSFKAASRALYKWKADSGMDWTWANYNSVHIKHLTTLPPLGRYQIHTGGNARIVNATRKNNGPSWRMIVELGPEVKAQGIFPGGESGNPGSHFYDNAVDDWAAGRYYDLNYITAEQKLSHPSILAQQVFQP